MSIAMQDSDIEVGSALRAPFPWFGGKRRVADLVWSRFGDVATYNEPFAGSLAVLLARPHEPRVETVNDLDSWACVAWRAHGGYSRSERGVANRDRERIWFSPHCLKGEQRSLFEVTA